MAPFPNNGTVVSSNRIEEHIRYDLKVVLDVALTKAAKSNVKTYGEIAFNNTKKTALNHTKVRVLTLGDYQFGIPDTFFHTKEREL